MALASGSRFQQPLITSHDETPLPLPCLMKFQRVQPELPRGQVPYTTSTDRKTMGTRTTTPLLAAALTAGFFSLVALGACSDNPSNPDQATVTMQAEMSRQTVTLARRNAEAETAAGAEFDSLRVSRVRMLVRRLILHRDKEDTAGDRTVKTDPFVITMEASGAKTFATVTVPPGTYDKIKFEFHKPESSQVQAYLGIPEFVEFVTGDRTSIIIEGVGYKNGVQAAFTYKSDVSANLSLPFDQVVTLSGGTTSVLALSIDPTTVFKRGGRVLDPRDGSNESEIDNAIKVAIKAVKK